MIFWLSNKLFYSQDLHDKIADIIQAVTFLSLFIIQKSFNRYSAQVHLKMNELISSHETANNSVMDTSQKTEKEIRDLSREYIDADEIMEKEIQEIVAENDIENKI